MGRILLIHWNRTEAASRAGLLRAAGYDCVAVSEIGNGPEFLRQMGSNPPAAIIIDLSRVPSHGRDVALAFRSYKPTRRVPLVFVEGDPEKVARLKDLLPDAAYTSWADITFALAQAIAHPPAQPVVPESRMAGYSGKPLVVKLGIKANSAVALVGAPLDFRTTLGDLPNGVQLRDGLSGTCDLILWFVRTREELRQGIAKMAEAIGRGSLWIIWPKKASGVTTDLSEQTVRETGLAAGLVDYKICAIDATWSGLLFARRKTKSVLGKTT